MHDATTIEPSVQQSTADVELGKPMPQNAPECPTPEARGIGMLTPAQLRAIKLLFLGHRDRDVIAALRIDRKTLYRWRTRHPAFRAELARRRESLWHNNADHLGALLPRALKVLARQLKSNYDITSFRAATSVLKLAAANKLTPPNDPTDEREILRQEILKDRLRANDPNTTIDDADLAAKLQELLADDPTHS